MSQELSVAGYINSCVLSYSSVQLELDEVSQLDELRRRLDRNLVAS